MNIEGLMVRPSGLQEYQAVPGLGVRVLGGELSGMRPGDQIPATVLNTTRGGTLLQLPTMQVTVEAQPNLLPGTQLNVRVANVGGQAMLQLLPQAQTGGNVLPPLFLGQEITGRVLQQLAGGQVLLDLQGTAVAASAPEQLPVDADLPLRVAQLEPRVVLEILNRPANVEAQALQLLRAQLTDPLPTGPALQQLQQALTQLPPTAMPSLARFQTFLSHLLPGNAALTPEQVATVIRQGGLQYEARLAQAVLQGPEAMLNVANEDLKAWLLRVLDESAKVADTLPVLSGRPGPSAGLPQLGPEVEVRLPLKKMLDQAYGATNAREASAPQTEALSLRELVQAQLQRIESQQAANVLARLHGDPYILQIPFYWNNNPTTALLAIEPDRQPGKQDQEPAEAFNILFRLDLEGLGTTQIDGFLTPQRLRVFFYATEGPALDLLRAELPAFRDALLALGYQEAWLDARPLKEMPASKRDQFAGLVAGVPPRVHLLDMRA